MHQSASGIQLVESATVSYRENNFINSTFHPLAKFIIYIKSVKLPTTHPKILPLALKHTTASIHKSSFAMLELSLHIPCED